MCRSAYDMILYIINPKLHTKNQLELMSGFPKFASSNIQHKNTTINGTYVFNLKG